MAAHRDQLRANRELWVRAVSCVVPVSGLVDGCLAFGKLSCETSSDFAARLQVAAWVENQEVVGLVDGYRVVCFPGQTREAIIKAVEACT